MINDDANESNSNYKVIQVASGRSGKFPSAKLVPFKNEDLVVHPSFPALFTQVVNVPCHYILLFFFLKPAHVVGRLYVERQVRQNYISVLVSALKCRIKKRQTATKL